MKSPPIVDYVVEQGWGGGGSEQNDYVLLRWGRGRGGQVKTTTWSGKVTMKSTTVVDYVVEVGWGV